VPNASIKLPSIPTFKLKHGVEHLKEAMLDPNIWERGYRMNSVAPGELKFPSFEKNIQHGLTAGELLARKMPCYMGVDLAGKRRPGNAIVVVGAAANNRRALMGVRFGAWRSPETARNIAEMDTLFNPQWIQVENNAYQESLIDWMKEADYSCWPKIEPFTTGANKADPDVGLPVLEVEYFNNAWIIPGAEFEGHDPNCACDWCRIVREIKTYPRGSSTDGVMAKWFARDALAKWAPKMGGTPLRRNFTKR
jgi:hypothetical protein